MNVIYEKVVLSKSEGYGPFYHVSVCWEDNGTRLTAFVNPDLYYRHGLQSIGMPGWASGSVTDVLKKA